MVIQEPLCGITMKLLLLLYYYYYCYYYYFSNCGNEKVKTVQNHSFWLTSQETFNFCVDLKDKYIVKRNLIFTYRYKHLSIIKQLFGP